MMQTDVSTVHLNSTGFAYIGRTRVKGLVITSTATGGSVSIWDSTTIVIGATYEQAANTVTVTKVAHGLSTGQRVGISFGSASGNSATNGNYTITRLTADTFSLTDINSRTIVAGTACSYIANPAGSNSTQWHMTIDTAAAAETTNIVFPGEGILIENALYITMSATNIPAVTAFYG